MSTMDSQQGCDIITLQNFHERLPSWDPAGPNHLYAIVDMGSNGIRFSISDLTPPRSRLLRCLYRERAAISLFDALQSSVGTNETHTSAVDSPLTFPPDTINQVASTLARFRRIADAHGVPLAQFSVLATEAMRRAANATEILAAIRSSAGVGVHILDPSVETLFGAVMGSRSAFVDVSHGGLFLDLGGGSVQMTWVETSLPEYEIAAAVAGQSMPFGAARLIRVLEDRGQPVEAQVMEKSKLREGMKSALLHLCEEFPTLRKACQASTDTTVHGRDPNSGIDIYMCGGGFRGYGSMLMHNDPIQPYPIPSVGTYTVAGELFTQTAEMRRVNTQNEGKIYGMSTRRRQQFPAIAEVVEAFIETAPKIRTVTFCAGSNKDGALFVKLPEQLRESNPLEVLAAIPDKGIPVAKAVVRTLKSAVPANLDISGVPTIFSLGLGSLFTQEIWSRLGEASEANASRSLHNAITRDPSAPGLTHLARAVLGLTACARWGANLGPIDIELHRNLRNLVKAAHKDALFWADYVGAVASAIVDILPAWPDSDIAMEKTIKLEATEDQTKKGRDRINLTIWLSPESSKGLDPESVATRFAKIGKKKGESTPVKKVKATVKEMV